MDINSILNDGPPTIERCPSSRKMSSSQRADSISSTTPSMNNYSPKTNGHTISTSTTTPTSIDSRPRSSGNSILRPLPEKPVVIVAPSSKRKRENGESRPKKRRLRERPLWAQKIPERIHSGISWHMLPKASVNGQKISNRGVEPEIRNSPGPQLKPGPVVVPPLNPFGSTYCNTTPGDELTRNVADFLYVQIGPLLNILPAANVEIEAKLGRIINRDTDERVVLPVQTEAVMTPNPGGLRTIFQSSMAEEEHIRFNQQLNAHTTQIPGPNGKTHERVLDIDSFWHLPRAEALAHIPGHLQPYILGPGNQPVKLRLTHSWYDTTTAAAATKKTTPTKSHLGPEKACIIKRRLQNLDIYNPRWPFDWRISINIEYPYPGPRHGLEPATETNGTTRVRDRAKNRLKYFYPVCDIDFTKVTSVPAGEVPGNASWEEHEHELEVELRSEFVFEQLGVLRRNAHASRYEDLVRVLVDNVRVLTRSLGGRV